MEAKSFVRDETRLAAGEMSRKMKTGDQLKKSLHVMIGESGGVAKNRNFPALL